MISRGPVTVSSYSKRALDVVRLTEADLTPGKRPTRDWARDNLSDDGMRRKVPTYLNRVDTRRACHAVYYEIELGKRRALDNFGLKTEGL